MNYLYAVLCAVNLDKAFSYYGPAGLSLGQVVAVPFRQKLTVGVIWQTEEVDSGVELDKIKEIQVIYDFVLASQEIKFIQQASAYTFVTKGRFLAMILLSSPQALEKNDHLLDLPHFISNKNHTIVLNQEQKVAATSIIDSCGMFSPFVLDGVTSSGKTVVYFAAIDHILQLGQKIIVLMPEISLTQAIIDRFTQHFGFAPFIWHSLVRPAQKRKVWKTLQQKGPAVICGARSALFLPVQDLGLIIVDEEHDATYKQTEQAIFNARDLAVLKAKYYNIPVVLGSATPSLETFYNVSTKRYGHLHLKQRHGHAKLPQVEIVTIDSRDTSLLSKRLQEEIQLRLQRQEQSLIFLNRRGYASTLICQKCGIVRTCPGCEVALTWHQSKHSCLCHFCGFFTKGKGNCSNCGAHHIQERYHGVEYLYEEITQFFPQARVTVFSSDTLNNAQESQHLFHQLHNGEIDIIIGTQIIAKGHDLDRLTLVGILDFDRTQSQFDLRASEKTLQLMTQVGGRAARRAEQNGMVVIQTKDPHHPLLSTIVSYDRDGFYAQELAERKRLQMPPFARIILLTVAALTESDVDKGCNQLSLSLPKPGNIRILGPVAAPLYRLRSYYRKRYMLISDSQDQGRLQSFVRQWLAYTKLTKRVKISIDVDPLSFL